MCLGGQYYINAGIVHGVGGGEREVAARRRTGSREIAEAEVKRKVRTRSRRSA